MNTVSISFTAILFVALLFMLAAFALARLLRSLLGANGAIWLTLAGLVLFGMLLLAMLRIGISLPQPVEIVTPMPQLGVAESRIHVATQAPLTPAVETPPAPEQSPSPDQSQSIEEMWKQLTAPRINLDEVAVTAEVAGPRSPEELHAAAKVILSASMPGADPFTQGWLVNAAKSILDGRVVPPPPAAPAAPATVIEQVVEIDGQQTPSATVEDTEVDWDPFGTEETAPAKPDWLITPPKRVGNVRRIVVASGPFSTVEECQRDLDRKMYDVVRNRMIDISQSSLTRRTGAARLDDMGLGGDYIRRELCTDEFVDTVDSSVGEMKQVYALLEFNEAQDAMLIDRARSYSRQEGLQDVSLIGGGLLASVATLFGLLKVDTWTRGYYTKRLFLGVPAAIITVLALLMS